MLKINQKKIQLHEAVLIDSVVGAEFLLQHGAKANVHDDLGWTPVHYAAYLDNYICLQLLLDRSDVKEARVRTRPNGGATHGELVRTFRILVCID